MAITLSKFFNDVILNDFPNARIQFRNKHWLCRYFHWSKGVVWLIGNTIWFDSEQIYNNLAFSNQLDAILAHEYVHMWQKRTNYITWLEYGLPQTSVIFTIPLAILYNSWILILLAILWAFIPRFAKRRIESEVEAYKMAMLVKMVRLSIAISPSKAIMWYRNLPEQLTDNLFSLQYWCMWTNSTTKEKYYQELYEYYNVIGQVLHKFAIDKNISYIKEVTGIHFDVLFYYTHGALPTYKDSSFRLSLFNADTYE